MEKTNRSNEELMDVLTAISVVAKRLAQNLQKETELATDPEDSEQ